MNWKELVEEVTAVGAGGDPGGDFAQPITGVEYDSRKVRPGSVFVAMKGGSTDGNRYGCAGHRHRLRAEVRSPVGF